MLHTTAQDAGWNALLAACALLQIWVAPYTKVEESFNLQAIHDMCHHGLNITAYDHQAFPGVVPRTFLGAIAVAIPTCPITAVMGFAGYSKLAGLYISRAILAMYAVAGLLRLTQAVKSVLGPATANCFVLLTCVQFHTLFYAGRPLPNSMAMPLVCWALGDWLRRRPQPAIILLAFTSLVVRCDLLPLACLLGLHMLAARQISLPKGAAVAALAAIASLGVSVGVDSWLWGRWLWPEGSVLWFNTAENRSSEWGTQPMHWYFTSALPRALLVALPLAVLGALLERRVRALAAIILIYIACYSLLPHKELRFLLPVLPSLNVLAAVALAWLLRGRRKSRARGMLLLVALGGVVASAALTCLFLAVSRQNYPGGHALERLHALEGDTGPSTGRHVHIDALPAMTGISRFGEIGPPWTYSKEEGLNASQLQQKGFTHLLSALPRVGGFEVVEVVGSYSRLRIHLSPRRLLESLWALRSPIEIEQSDAVYIHRSHETI